jgi:inner membrane protein
MMPQMIEPYAAWMCAGLILAIMEMLVPGVYLMWLALAALITGACAWALPLGTGAQMLLFSAVAIVTLFIGRRWTGTAAIASEDPLLNDRMARLVGEPVTVVDALTAGRGRVRLGDSEWPAKGDDAPTGTVLRVTGHDAGVLIVGH